MGAIQSLHDSQWEHLPDGRPFPTALDPFTVQPV
jgi:hypothetical protein